MNEIIHNTQKSMSIKAYRKMKLKMLKEFCIYLTDEEKNHLQELTKEIEIDNFCISMFRKYIKTSA